MIVPLYPPLDGEAAERFHAFAIKLACAQRAFSKGDMKGALGLEVDWCRSATYLGKGALAYEACVRVLTDLARLRWRIVEQGYGFALENPKEMVGGRPTEEAIASKKLLRSQLQPVVDEQHRHPAVRDFITKMEGEDRLGRRSVRLLMADGAELATRLAPARALAGDDRAAALGEAIRPYLQQADHTVDPTTGRRLREIWRYFRYSWSIPQVPTPGRQLLYLVRDASHPAHPIIGIAALNNCPLEMGEKRETYIGWHLNAVIERFTVAAIDGHDALEAEVYWLEQQLETSLAEIEWTNLVTPEQVAAPDDALIRRLTRRGQDFARLREALLREVAGADRDAFDADRWHDEAAPPVDDQILGLEPKASVDARMHTARKQLVAKKRASALSRLLSARLIIARNRAALIDPALALATLAKDQVRSAIHIVLEALKGRRAGANLLEITTCGAIAPYNHILGGKLVALLMLSPRIGADYRSNYAGPSIISSQMRNRPVTRDNALVYLGTTSLYVHGSSQYNRLRLPAGTIAPDQAEISYHAIGQTSGFGTVQFSPDTSRAIDAYLSSEKDFKEVNSVFGEGTSPKLRKLKMGLRKLGFDPDKLIQHRQHRLIYAAPLFPKARDWLVERTTDLPSYLAAPDQYADATERIVEFWRRRWLASRLEYQPAMISLALDAFVPLADAVAQRVGVSTE
ncbi:MAG: Druantia anti-phage system protein DruA [Propylenella sp.]